MDDETLESSQKLYRMAVGRIVYEKDCIRFYEHPETRWHFHVMASPDNVETQKIRPGDMIEYTDGGVNFGWFHAKHVPTE